MFDSNRRGRTSDVRRLRSDIKSDVVTVPFTAIDHVQLAMPPGGEETARQFYRDLLGMAEIPKPPELAKRGGCWFESGEVQIHLGVEKDFRPAQKAHPALRCRDYAAFIARLSETSVGVAEVDDMAGVRRCHIHDPFGNRIELIEFGAENGSRA
jgi:catechol 2,3-dioxygenase-like lactoylglutathione lyase family enzyme